MASKAPRGVYLPAKNLHFIKDKDGVRVDVRWGKVSAEKLKQLKRFLEHLR
jgi:hypothetical protein